MGACVGVWAEGELAVDMKDELHIGVNMRVASIEVAVYMHM